MEWRAIYRESKQELKSEISNNYNKKGYWKQSLVCNLAAKFKCSMYDAWTVFNNALNNYIDYISLNNYTPYKTNYSFWN